MSAFGFSVGDVYLAITLSVQATKALRDSSGIPEECRSAIIFLDAVRIALEQYNALKIVPAGSKDHDEIQACVQDCCQRIISFAKRLERYGSGFAEQLEGKRRWTDRSHRGMLKLQWTFAMKDELNEFMAAVAPRLNTLQLFLSTVEAKSYQIMETKVDTLDGKVESVDGKVGSMDVKLELFLVRQKQTTQEIKESFLQCCLLLCCCLQAFHELLLSYTVVRRGPSLLQNTDIILTDALGRTLNLPYEHFSDWDMITARLTVAFKGCTGDKLHANGKYGLYTLKAGGVFLHESNWKQEVRRGLKIVMAVSVSSNGLDEDQCPRCTSTEYDAETTKDGLEWRI